MADLNINDTTSLKGMNLIGDVELADLVLENAVDSGVLYKVNLIQALAVSGAGTSSITVTLTDDVSEVENVIVPTLTNNLGQTYRFLEDSESIYLTEGYTLTVSDSSFGDETNVLISYEEIS